MFCMISLGMPWSCMVLASINISKILCFVSELSGAAPTLWDEIIQHLRVSDPVYWVEQKDTACRKPALELLYVVIVPWHLVLASAFILVWWFCRICNAISNKKNKMLDTDVVAAVDLPMLAPFLKPIHIALNALMIAEPLGGWTT